MLICLLLIALFSHSYFRAVWINLPLSIFAVSLCALCGCVIYAFYADCDPIANDQIKKADQVVLIFCFVLFLLNYLCLFDCFCCFLLVS